MPRSICAITNMCPSDTHSAVNTISDVGKIVGIVIGSLLGLAFLICVIVIIYLVCCKRKPQTQVWAQPYPRPQAYGQSTSMFPYTNYPQESIQPPQTDLQRIIEEPPPSYEEISAIENSNKKT